MTPREYAEQAWQDALAQARAERQAQVRQEERGLDQERLEMLQALRTVPASLSPDGPDEFAGAMVSGMDLALVEAATFVLDVVNSVPYLPDIDRDQALAEVSTWASQIAPHELGAMGRGMVSSIQQRPIQGDTSVGDLVEGLPGSFPSIFERLEGEDRLIAERMLLSTAMDHLLAGGADLYRYQEMQARMPQQRQAYEVGSRAETTGGTIDVDQSEA